MKRFARRSPNFHLFATAQVNTYCVKFLCSICAITPHCLEKFLVSWSRRDAIIHSATTDNTHGFQQSYLADSQRLLDKTAKTIISAGIANHRLLLSNAHVQWSIIHLCSTCFLLSLQCFWFGHKFLQFVALNVDEVCPAPTVKANLEPSRSVALG